MAWTINLKSLDNASVVTTSAPFKSARFTWAKDGFGAAEVELNFADLGTIWVPGQRRLLLLKDGVAKYGGWLDRLERSGTPSDPKYRVASTGLASVLAKRVVVGDFSRVSTINTTIATDLLAHVDAQSNDMTNFTAGTIVGTGAALTKYYCDGDVILDAINELANRDSGGFVWDLTPNGAFRAWVGGRGTDLSGSTTLAPGDVQDWSFIWDFDQFATYVMGIGDRNDDVPCGAPLTEVFSTLRTTYGRLEAVAPQDTTVEAELIEVADEELRARVASRAQLKTAWIEGRGPWAFESVWLDDIVNVSPGAEFGGDLDMRCVAIQLTLEPGLHEFVEMEWEAV